MKIKIATRDFGEMEIDKDIVITFKDGIFAFEECKEFVIIHKEDAVQKWLQYTKAPDPRFIIFDPLDLFPDYNPHIPDWVIKELDAKEDGISLFSIAVVPQDIKDMTLNLKSPIIVNFKKRLGLQVILDDQNYPVRQRVFKNEGGK